MTYRYIVALAAMLFAFDARAHEWYDYSCCSKKDCRQTTLGEVERHDDGWYVVQLKLTVPFSDQRIRRSRDPLIHICLMPIRDGETDLRCLYIPEVAG